MLALWAAAQCLMSHSRIEVVSPHSLRFCSCIYTETFYLYTLDALFVWIICTKNSEVAPFFLDWRSNFPSSNHSCCADWTLLLQHPVKKCLFSCASIAIFFFVTVGVKSRFPSKHFTFSWRLFILHLVSEGLKRLHNVRNSRLPLLLQNTNVCL